MAPKALSHESKNVIFSGGAYRFINLNLPVGEASQGSEPVFRHHMASATSQFTFFAFWGFF